MTPSYTDESVAIYLGDVRQVLAELPAESVQCCVTSPPYWGLRDYGTATWKGGDASCDHQSVRREYAATDKQASAGGSSRDPVRSDCRRCGARRTDSQLGLEATPQEYVAAMVDVFHEVRRVLRRDGTCWINLGDSYAANRGDGASSVGPKQATNVGANLGRLVVPFGLKPKDMVGIPWRVAFALQEDGWWLRSDIIWSKPNPMPESVTDRPTKAHEYLFLLTKSGTYYYDQAAISEPAEYSHPNGAQHSPYGQGFTRRSQLGIVRGKKSRALAMGRSPSGNEKPGADAQSPLCRNKRTVWEIATQPYPDAHFATFPEELARIPILAGTRPRDVVLDPFAGSGTTLAVAKSLDRQAIGIELNPAYINLIRRRCEGVAAQVGLPLEVPA